MKEAEDAKRDWGKLFYPSTISLLLFLLLSG